MAEVHETSRATEGASSAPQQTELRQVLCPFCGHRQANSERCERCRGLFEPLSRKATQIAMGPWYIRDEANPFRPGCSYETLKRQIEAGRVGPNSIIRGPTTRQFWSLARNVPGVAHLVGYCHRCGGSASPRDARCPACGEQFRGVALRNELGLMYPTPEQAESAQRELERQRRAVEMGMDPATVSSSASSPVASDVRAGEEGDLLGQVLQSTTSVAGARGDDAPASAAVSPGSGGFATASGSGAQALDFTPSPQASEGDSAGGGGGSRAFHPAETASAPSTPTEPSSTSGDSSDAHRSAALIWLLVLLNSLAAAGVVLLAWYFLF